MKTETPAQVEPGQTPFTWYEGTVQLFIVCKGVAFPHGRSCHVGSTIGEYDRAKPVGTDWERRYTQRAVDLLNAAYAAGDRRNDDETVRAAIRQAKQETPWKVEEWLEP